MKTPEETRAFFSADTLAALLGIEIDSLETGAAICSAELGDEHKNAVGAAQGGFIFSLADFTFAVAANCAEHAWVTLSGTISFVSSVRSGRLIAKARRVSERSRVCFYEVTVECDDKIVATAQFTGYRK